MEKFKLNHKKENLKYIAEFEITKIKPYKNNARLHKDKQVQQIANSIKEFNFLNPITLDEKYEVLAGHGRVLAAKKLDIKTVPVVIASSLSEKQKRLYRIADNKLTLNGKWDENLLALELKDLSNLDIDLDLSITGFETTEIDLLIDDVSEIDDNSDDQIPEPNLDNPALTKPGDIWLLDKHRIICGDSTQHETYERLMNGKKAQMIFTDPPYNVKIDGNVGGLGTIKHREFAMASGEMTSGEFEEFLSKFIKLNIQYSTPGSLHFHFMDWRHSFELESVARKLYTEHKNTCVWVKDNGGMGSLYRSQHELIYVFKNGTNSHINNVQLGSTGRYRTNVWNYAGVNSFGKNRDDLKMHPTVKPVAMIKDAILDVTKRNQVILDSFLGSGSTLIAAEKSGRICYGIEIDPHYVDVAIERFQTLTGKDVINEASGKTYNELKEGCND